MVKPLARRLIQYGAVTSLLFGLATPNCVTAAFANNIEIRSVVHCDAYDGSRPDPAWTQPVTFILSGQRLAATRRTRSQPGQESYSGSIGPDGLIRVRGYGAYTDPSRLPWESIFEGRLANRGETALSGELRVKASAVRPCSISMGIDRSELKAQFAQVKSTAAVEPSPPHKAPTSPNYPLAAPQAPSPTSTAVTNAPPANSAIVTKENAVAANNQIAYLKAQIDLLEKILSEQSELAKNAAPENRATVTKAIDAVTAQKEKLKSEYSTADNAFGTYLTSITPKDRDLYLTARKSSEIFPKIPYYIPGTQEVGEFWVEPGVSQRGELQFGFKFVDADATVEKVRETIEMSLPEIEDAQKALFKLQAWSDIAISRG
jgi:hypothetical protein